MIYPKNFEQKIGFDIILKRLSSLCISPLGKKYVNKIRFLKNIETVECLLEQINEFKEIFFYTETFPAQNYFDVTPELKRIQILGTVIEIDSLFDLKSSLSTVIDILNFFSKTEKDQFPELKKLTNGIHIETTLMKSINTIIDDKGKIRDNASENLKKIRIALYRNHNKIDQQINNLLSIAQKEGWTSKDVKPTYRNNRLVIPVDVAYKRKVKGFIHDESATGQTVFIEPTEIFDFNNEIRELLNAEHREIIKILIQFTDDLRPQLNDLLSAFRMLGLFDFIRAKARFALEVGANKPILENKMIINWVNAKHPLLYLALKEQKRTIVPLTIKLDEQQRILIVSGPNAGGKSVCLKTIGLNQYMLQCGVLPVLDEVSETGIFEKIFIEIGDEQSLENDLSTYSSHLLNIKHFILQSDEKTLFLIDEFGTGTEPQLGGAIAEAALERINEKKAFGVITTHYANLKLLAGHQEGIVNGAMLFDTKEMKPLYLLKIGNPGSSFAFEIARNIGFPKLILKNAAKKTGKTQLDFDQQLQQLEVDKERIAIKEKQLQIADDFLKELTEKYNDLLNKTIASESEIIKKANDKALELLDDSNKLIEKTIKEIKEAKAEKEKTKKIREKIKEKVKELKKDSEIKKIKTENEKTVTIDHSEFKIGDMVRISGQDSIGEIIEIFGEEAMVSFHSIKFRASLEKLKKVDGNNNRKKSMRKNSGYEDIYSEINTKMANFSYTIDVRGKRGEEALNEIRDYIDDAILLNVKEVNILHGKGDGILRKIIREFLSTSDEVKSFKNQNIEFGGDGITVVSFKS